MYSYILTNVSSSGSWRRSCGSCGWWSGGGSVVTEVYYSEITFYKTEYNYIFKNNDDIVSHRKWRGDYIL